MKLRNLLLDLSKDDILKLISMQDKTIIKSLELEDLIKVSGSYKLMGMNIDFNGTMSINSFKNNIIFITINNFKISNKATSNPLVKGSLAILRKSINDIEGMSSKNNEREHVYYKYPDKFGTTDKRITKTNPDGAQSYCVDCRGGSNISNNSDSRLCSELEQ